MNRNSNFIWVIIILLVIIGLIYWMVRAAADNVVVTPSPTPNVTVSPIATSTPNLSTTATTTVMGTYVCLPHRDTSGPTTLECAFGVQLDNGDYYVLDTSMLSTTTIDMVEVGNRVTMQGRLGTTTPQMLSTYNIEGSIQVGEIEEI